MILWHHPTELCWLNYAMRLPVTIACLLILDQSACAGLPGAESPQFSTSPPKPGHAAVYIGRPHGWNVSYIPLSVELDGRPLAQLGINTYTRIELPPGTYNLAAADSYLTKITYGMPRALQMKVEAGKSYFVLPTRSVENVRPAIEVIGKNVVPTQTGDVYGGFAVQTVVGAGNAAPSEFAQLSYVVPEANFGGSTAVR
jgi:hypothetical protein